MPSPLPKIDWLPAGPARKLPAPQGFQLASTSVGLNGEAVQLFAQESRAGGLFAKVFQRGGASFAKTHSDAPYAGLVVVSDANSSGEIGLERLTATFPHVETLPNGGALVVASRCYVRPDGSCELNATVFTSDGREERKILLGDGISHVQADSSGKFWVGYFDEGVYGNFGWGVGTSPIGTSGLSSFTPEGKKFWDFHAPSGFDPISDCYALNVTANEVWTYFYTDFAIARIDREKSIRCWRTETRGEKAIAAGKGKAVLWGGYNTNLGTARLLELGEYEARVVAEATLKLPQKFDIAKARVIGRGNALHVFVQDEWHIYSMDSLG